MRGGGVCWDMSSTCVQGGVLRPLGGYQPSMIMEPHSPAPAWQMHHPVVTKQEPMDEDRNDSGINSGTSDFHSSSPGSDHSQEGNVHPSYSSSVNQIPQSSQFYTTPVISRAPASDINYYSNSVVPSGFNPLVTPSSEAASSSQPTPIIHRSPGLTDSADCISRQEDQNSTLTSCISPKRRRQPSSSSELDDSNSFQNHESDDPLRRLQMSLEKNCLVPSMLSPKTTSEHSADDENKSDGDVDEYDEQGIRVPRVNSHGKVKTFKCKQCDFVAVTKLEFWEHSKAHIKADKLLTCPKCPFVTEYKHHLEYHLRNHFGSKPFKCDKCSYSCVNKSMLNSHMKSHSNIYQYRCSDCSYATKYCHSLKLHLRKYSHKPAMVLNPDGTPNPLPIIDVYGTRRGPKQKHVTLKPDDSDNPAKLLQNQFAHFMLTASPQMQLPFAYPFLRGFPNPLSNPLIFKQNLELLAKQREDTVSADKETMEKQDEKQVTTEEDTSNSSIYQDDTGVLDLSKPDSNSSEQPPKNRRKGRAFKLERLPINESTDDEDEERLKINEDSEDGDQKLHSEDKAEEEEITNNNKPGNFCCQFCNIAFGDIILYTMHMGYHGYKDPFTCNMCGEECNDKVSFFLHIARNPHT